MPYRLPIPAMTRACDRAHPSRASGKTMPLRATIRRQKLPAPSAQCDFLPRDIGCLLSYVTHRRTAVTQQLLLANPSPCSALARASD